jgi:phthalate 4,5-dioxygenase oxygenase subunit
MLTREENELLCRVGPGTPMGELIRRFWVPACLSEELPEPDCDPIRVRLLGEDLVAFRDSAGRVGVLDEHCPHRGASLVFGRNEEGGLRCLYHGWKMDVAGAILETPCEPADSRMRFHIKHTAYPVVEQGDVVWVYMGPKDKQPPFPDFEWTLVPNANRVVAKVGNDCNYLQGVEGVVDSSHVDMLHSGRVIMEKLPYVAPTYEVEDQPYGFRYAAIRLPPFRVIGQEDVQLDDPSRSKYVRTSNFVMPFHTLVPPSNYGHMMIFVPIDDEHNWNYSIYYSPDRVIDRTELAERRRSSVGPDLTADHSKLRTAANRYRQDRRAMLEKRSWSGIDANPNQDAAMTESMGPIYDRTRERLGQSDAAVVHMRQRLLGALRAFMAGNEPLGLDQPIPYPAIRSQAIVIPIDADWRAMVPEMAGLPA